MGASQIILKVRHFRSF